MLSLTIYTQRLCSLSSINSTYLYVLMWTSSIDTEHYATVYINAFMHRWIGWWTTDMCEINMPLQIHVTRLTLCLSISAIRWPRYSWPWLLSWGLPLTHMTWAPCHPWLIRPSVQSKWRRLWLLVRNSVIIYTALSFTEVAISVDKPATSVLWFPVLQTTLSHSVHFPCLRTR